MRLPFHRFWRMALALAVLALALLHALGVHESDLLTLADQRLYDARLRLFMPATLDERVVIVDVDEASLAELGQWPWPRERMAELVEEVLRRQRASVIGFDAVFAEAGRGSEESDARFAAALQGRPAVLGYYLTSDRQGRRSGALPAPIATLLAAQDTPALMLWDGCGASVAKLASAAPQGFFNALVDSDGIVRSVPLVAAVDGGWRESLALAVVRQYLYGGVAQASSRALPAPALQWAGKACGCRTQQAGRGRRCKCRSRPAARRWRPIAARAERGAGLFATTRRRTCCAAACPKARWQAASFCWVLRRRA